MTDPFLRLQRSERPAKKGHGERAHSKFAASAAERWLNCPGSVELSEGMPDKSSPWAEEGTRAHEVLEQVMLNRLGTWNRFHEVKKSGEMFRHAQHAADFILGLYKRIPNAEVWVETKIPLPFIHSDAFGTFDGAVVEHFGTLHVFDYKYGAGTPVSARHNLQMVFYALGLAYQYNWNFKRVRMWIIQPRIRGYDGPTFWEITTRELMSYIDVFFQGVQTVLARPDLFKEGSWCHWCKAKSVCPLKRQARAEKAQSIFLKTPIKTEKGVNL